MGRPPSAQSLILRSRAHSAKLGKYLSDQLNLLESRGSGKFTLCGKSRENVKLKSGRDVRMEVTGAKLGVF